MVSRAPAAFAPQVRDTERRLDYLFDHLNNEELVMPDTIERLSEIADAIQARDHATAARLQLDLQREKTSECGNWAVSYNTIFNSKRF